MMEVRLYVLEDADGNEASSGYWRQDQIEEARDAARRAGARLVANVFEYADSELVEDFTERGERP